MNDSRLTDINQLRRFLKGTQKFDLSLRLASITEKYTFINKSVKRLDYKTLKEKDKKVVRNYLKKFTGYKHSQLCVLIALSVGGKLKKKTYKRVRPHRIYSSGDIKLLEKTDELHLRLSDRATKEIMRREFEVFGKTSFGRVSKVSHAHISNLRKSMVYKNSWVNHTKARTISIGVTKPPKNMGKPGSIRVDAVHQRDVYHINSVDEITQWEVIVCVPKITEYYMVPAFECMLKQYPFVVFNFHSDRGGENINYKVANLLQELLIKQTKSRARHPNDNALVETKNGSVIRKNMGWEHIDKQMAKEVNTYYKNYFNPYLNFHRPCGFPTTQTNKKGKKRRVYKIYKTPYEALKSMSGASKFLKPEISFKKLDTIAYKMSDNEFAEILRKEERKLFEKINKKRGSRG